MGTRGPIPKREQERRRRNKNEDGIETTTVEAHGIVDRPAADPEWHPIARMLWDSLSESGQAVFFEPSDWAFAYSLCDDLSYYKNGAKRSGQMLSTIYSGMTDLLVTEAARRRVRMEIERGPSLESVPVSVLDDFR